MRLSSRRMIGTSALVALVAVLGLPPAMANADQAVQCGDTLTASIQLDADLNCTGKALTIAASNVTIDLGGHTVIGTAGGIVVQDQNGVTIANGTVGGGIRLTGGNSGVLSNIHVDGLALDSVSGTQIADSVVQNGALTLQNGDISLVRSSLTGVRGRAVASGVSMTDSTVTDSGFISEMTGFTLTGNTLTRSQIGGDESGAQVATENKFVQSELNFFMANRLDIENNQFTGPGSGLGVSDTTFKASVVKGNTFNGSDVGLGISTNEFGRLNDISIQHNVFVDNTVAGIFLQVRQGTSSHSIAITDNVFSSNGKASNGRVDQDGLPVDDGLHVAVPAGSPVTIGDNFTLNNADHGIEAKPGTVVDGGGNMSVGDPAGCLGVVCR